MGPIWDFDLAFGNVNYNGNDSPEGFWIAKAPWFARLLEDPVFYKEVKCRFEYYHSIKDDIFRRINERAEYLKFSVDQNNNRWNPRKEYSVLKDWLEKRFSWLEKAYSE